MRLLYNILFPVFFLFSAPYYFWKMRRRGNWRKDFGQRFGSHDPSLKKDLADKQVLWLHAVSVGEANICVSLVQSLQKELKDLSFVVSTTTTTGMAELQTKLPENIHKIY